MADQSIKLPPAQSPEAKKSPFDPNQFEDPTMDPKLRDWANKTYNYFVHGGEIHEPELPVFYGADGYPAPPTCAGMSDEARDKALKEYNEKKAEFFAEKRIGEWKESNGGTLPSEDATGEPVFWHSKAIGCLSYDMDPYADNPFDGSRTLRLDSPGTLLQVKGGKLIAFGPDHKKIFETDYPVPGAGGYILSLYCHRFGPAISIDNEGQDKNTLLNIKNACAQTIEVSPGSKNMHIRTPGTDGLPADMANHKTTIRIPINNTPDVAVQRSLMSPDASYNFPNNVTVEMPDTSPKVRPSNFMPPIFPSTMPNMILSGLADSLLPSMPLPGAPLRQSGIVFAFYDPKRPERTVSVDRDSMERFFSNNTPSHDECTQQMDTYLKQVAQGFSEEGKKLDRGEALPKTRDYLVPHVPNAPVPVAASPEKQPVNSSDIEAPKMPMIAKAVFASKTGRS